MEYVQEYVPSKAPHSESVGIAGYVSEVDALRCVAMTAVVATHCGILPIGWAGVWLFFVISGFAITASLLTSDCVTHQKSLLMRNFYIRRCLRIWPLYFLVVTSIMIAAVIARRGDVLEGWPWLATFTYNYYIPLHYGYWATIGHLWSISVEEQFYFIFPFLFAFLSRRRLVAALWIFIALGPVLRTLLTFWLDHLSRDDHWKDVTLLFFAPAHFDAFAAGSLLALFRSFLASRLYLARIFLAAAIGAAVVYACIFVSINAATRGFGADVFDNVFSGTPWGHSRQIWLYSIIAGTGSALIALILAGESWLMAACRLPLLRPIGRISFGAYVFHLPVLSVHNHLWPAQKPNSSLTYSLGEFVFVYPVTLLIAFLSFRYFEEPILKLRARFF